ncbi:MAG: glycosyltransferase family 9 protein [Brumimicrobium sp.]
MTKILVIRFSSIGDIVLTTPILRCIKAQINDVQLHVLTKHQYGLLFKSNPNVDVTHEWGGGNKEVARALIAEQFDYVVDLHNNIRTKKIKTFLRTKSSAFPKLNVQKWLYVNFKWNKLPDIHIVDRYFEAVKKLDVVNDKKGLDYFIPSEDNVDVLETFKTNKFVAVALGAQFATKRLPNEKLSGILNDISATIVLLGGKEDLKIADELISMIDTDAVYNMCGKLNLNQSASVVKQANVILTHDTGLMHIAAAFKTPIVSVWGNTVPAFGMYPYIIEDPSLYSMHEVKGLSCRPCSKIGFKKCPHKHFKCMMDQDENEIREQIIKRLY